MVNRLLDKLKKLIICETNCIRRNDLEVRLNGKIIFSADELNKDYQYLLQVIDTIQAPFQNNTHNQQADLV